MNILLLGFGLALLVGGGEALVRGASSLARSLGVSSLTIGLTVIAFGTSAPELAVNVLAALRGNTSISFGNIIGSNMANIGLIVASTALLQPVWVRRQVVGRELPMMLLATAAAGVLAFDVFLRGERSDVYDRGDGLTLILFFLVFVYYTLGDLRRQRSSNAPPNRDAGAPNARPARRSAAFVALGLLGLCVGAELTVRGAVGVARSLGISEVVIGLTVVAIGTSLPELVASLIATVRGEVDLAIGNVIGSNIFNLLLVAGLTATVRPIAVPDGGHADLGAMAALSVLLVLVSMSHSRRIIRLEAGGLFLVYAVYLVARSAGG